MPANSRPKRHGSPPRTFDPEAPVLVLAPHLEYPIRRGDDLLIDRRWSAFSHRVPYVDVVATDRVVRYEGGRRSILKEYTNRHRSKPLSALRTIVRRSHYLREKFVTTAYQGAARPYLDDPAYRTVVVSYVATTSLVNQFDRGRLYLVETHNDEFRWYADIVAGTRNPVSILAARQSRRWTTAVLRRHASDFVLLHVTEADAQGFAEHVPEQTSLVAPVGVTLPSEPAPPRDPGAPLRLVFVGSLHMATNVDALSHFGERFFPPLRRAFGDPIQVHVVGSRPGAEVERLCEEHGWHLHPDVSDDELHAQYEAATFALLPFPYATGAKLKLLEALGQGIPFLATAEVDAQLHTAPPHPCLLSNDPTAWVERLREVHGAGISAGQRTNLLDLARYYSWRNVVNRLRDDLSRH